ncbi:MAG: DinB family protein [Anaerolineae bacterium]|nr:DinB family protein [Anaerolineae bacterium]
MSDAVLRQHLVNLLHARQAYMGFEAAIANFPMAHINSRPTGVEYTFWHLLDHIRFAQWDILDYVRNANYQYTTWPDGYWQPRDAVTDAAGWNKTLEALLADRAELVRIVRAPETDLYAPIPHGEAGHNILREVLLVAEHNAYHLGEFGILRQVMGLW